jgi:hypothetical protein
MAINRHSPAVYSPQSSHRAASLCTGHVASCHTLQDSSGCERWLAFFAMAKFARKIFTVMRWQRGPFALHVQTLRRGEGHEPSRSGPMWGARG